MMSEKSLPQAQDALSYRIGASTVGENLRQAVARGDIVQHEGGGWELPKSSSLITANWLYGPVPTPFACNKLIGFLFRHAYGKAAVPFGCRTCFKVQIKPRSLRELQATLPVASAMPYAYKLGTGLGVPHQSGVYSALFYLDGLAQARSVYRDVRQAVDAAPDLGPEVEVLIKRGCTEYELQCGPSDTFTFDPALEAVERELLSRLRPPTGEAAKSKPRQAVFLRWIQVAYQVGDETYRDFTGGQRLYPAAVTYDPGSD
jgi:hypothetical protein